ncbi:hypothetical protein E2542_SST09226 [Spatholobus suberectus]|nr:hypothetical protein E2542_SST09226 [Spatholobus suberectus]
MDMINIAWYQLHLVKAEEARACIPKELRLVEAFGYTLGGFFLANYEDSPAGVFDELVVIAGLVWNRPTSCAWATKVYVNSDEACDHGRKEVGLPSLVTRFSKRTTTISKQPKGRVYGFYNMIGMDAIFNNPRDHLDVQLTEINCPDPADAFSFIISILITEPALSFDHWMGPAIKMSLPSFSGRTQYNPNLLKYACQIECRVRAMQPLKVSRAILTSNGDSEQHLEDQKDGTHNFSTCVMLSKHMLALKFSQMKMQVEAPIVLSQFRNS